LSILALSRSLRLLCKKSGVPAMANRVFTSQILRNIVSAIAVARPSFLSGTAQKSSVFRMFSGEKVSRAFPLRAVKFMYYLVQ
jgi:hypothetical protein